MSQESPKISTFLSGKPEISAVGQSALFSRLQAFLPQMDEANRNMTAGSTTDAFEIVEKEQNEESSSSDSSSDSEDSDCDLNVKEEKKKKMKQKKEPKLEASSENRIEIDLDVFQEQNSQVNELDVSVQPVESLPVAFQTKSEISEEKGEKKKKPLIEEI